MGHAEPADDLGRERWWCSWCWLDPDLVAEDDEDEEHVELSESESESESNPEEEMEMGGSGSLSEVGGDFVF